MIGGARGGIGKDVGFFVWHDSLWVESWRLGYGTAAMPSVPARDTSRYLIWRGVDNYGQSSKFQPFVFARIGGNGIAAAETLANVDAFSGFVYAGTATPTDRWAAISENGRLRLFHWGVGRAWREIGVLGLGSDGVTMIALNDSTVLVSGCPRFTLESGPVPEAIVSDGFTENSKVILGQPLSWDGDGEPMSWRILRGDSLGEMGQVPNHELNAQEPMLRQRPSGGQWMAWATQHPYIAIATFKKGSWSRPESLQCRYSADVYYYTYGPDLSRDSGEYPAVAWMGFNSITGVETICACMPTDSGFTMADNIPGSDHGGAPTVARDRNGDVWLAWAEYFGGAYWTHTYTTATVSSANVEAHGDLPIVAWRLSEAAPESWWAVLKAHAGAEFDLAARVRATAADSMSWADSSADLGDTLLRYRIRRECVDKRYEWLSDEVVWRRTTDAGPNPVRVGMRPPLPNPARENATVQFELSRAALVRVEVLDITGHLVRTLVKETSYPAGLHTLTWNGNDGEGRAVPSGLYFLRIRSGKESAARRLAWIR